MGKKAKAIGKGKVTPIQVAFIVDRYLSDNNFLQTRSSFRSEAQHLISKSPVNEAPRSLLTLSDMLDEYICLKEQKVMLSQEKTRLDQEKFRVHNLLKGMQNLMNSYNNNSSPAAAAAAAAAASIPVYNAPPSALENTTPTTTSQVTLKRRRNVSGPPLAAAAKRSRPQPSLKSSSTSKTVLPLPPPSTRPTPSVAKCLFNPAPQTPSPSPIDKASSPVDPTHSNKTPQFNRTVITSETIQVSPMKQVSYYSIESISSPRFTKRDHVKGRLDFDGHSETFTSDENAGSPSEDDAFDFDLSNFDCLGADFNLTELLGDFDLGGNGSSPESLSGSPDTMVATTGDDELVSGISSTMTEFRSDPGPNSVTSIKSITKCIKVFSPEKNRSPPGVDQVDF